MGRMLTIPPKPLPRLFRDPASVDAPPPPPPRERTKRVLYKDLDPRRITVGGTTLEAHLRSCGLDGALAIRDFLRAQDWSSFEARYAWDARGGRRPYHPASMLGIVLLGATQGIDSLRGLERLARCDLRAMWISGGIFPDHSSFGEFLGRHAEDVTDGLFERFTRELLKLTGGKATNVSDDGTVVQAAGSAYKRMTAEAAKEAAARARAEAARKPEDGGLAERADEAAHVAAVAKERAEARRAKGRDAEGAVVAPTEPEAVIQPLKHGGVAPSYKASVLANEQRMIVGVAVHPSSETAVVPELLDQAERIGGEAVKCLKCDAGYHCAEVGNLAVERAIDLLCPAGKGKDEESWEKRPAGKFAKSAFVYEEGSDTYGCPAGQRLTRRGRDGEAVRYQGEAEACSACPLRGQCTTSGEGRVIKRYAGDEVREAMRAVMRHPEARRRYRKRQAEVEPVFAQLRGVQGLRRFRRRGLAGARLEFVLHALAYNVNRGLRLARALGRGFWGHFASLLGALGARIRGWCLRHLSGRVHCLGSASRRHLSGSVPLPSPLRAAG